MAKRAREQTTQPTQQASKKQKPASKEPSSSTSNSAPVDMAGSVSTLRQLARQHLGPKINIDSLARKITPQVAHAQHENGTAHKCGRVSCAQVWRAQKASEIPSLPDAISVYVTKGKGHIANALSPFNLKVPDDMLGNFTVDGKAESKQLPTKSALLELVWQSAKLTPEEVDRTDAGEMRPNSKFFARRAKIFAAGVAKRRYLDRSQAISGAVFGGVDQPVVQWVESRSFYCTAYQRAVEQTPQFVFLRALVDAGFNLLLLGNDGFPMTDTSTPAATATTTTTSTSTSTTSTPSTPSANENAESNATHQAITNAYNSTSAPFGHERVLVAMLEKCKPWEVKPKCW